MIGSVSKQFTAAAILLLEEDGVLSTDDPVVRYLPELVDGDRITVEHLLTHTGGIVDIYSLERFGRDVIGHDGRVSGYASDLARYRDDGVTVVALSNVQSVARDEIRRLVAACWPAPTRAATPSSSPSPTRDGSRGCSTPRCAAGATRRAWPIA
jgi:hypothetical protein